MKSLKFNENMENLEIKSEVITLFFAQLKKTPPKVELINNSAKHLTFISLYLSKI